MSALELQEGLLQQQYTAQRKPFTFLLASNITSASLILAHTETRNRSQTDEKAEVMPPTVGKGFTAEINHFSLMLFW